MARYYGEGPKEMYWDRNGVMGTLISRCTMVASTSCCASVTTAIRNGSATSIRIIGN